MSSAPHTPTGLANACANAWQALRERKPRVHVITNSVAQPVTANVLLAAGAVPSMTVAPAEVPDFTGRADALAINLGTLDEQRRSAIPAALDVALDDGTPWVLDPVFVDVAPTRRDFARKLCEREPWVLRGNPAEIAALAEADDYTERTAMELALSSVSIVAATGESDFVTDGTARIRIDNGHPMLARVTGTGCAGSALTAAVLAVTADRMVAATTALLVMGLAAEKAAASAGGPGGFAWRLIDAVDAVTPDDIAAGARIE